MIRFDRPGALLQATENTMFYAVPTTGKADAWLFTSDFWLEKPQKTPVRLEEVSIPSLLEGLKGIKTLNLEWLEASVEDFQKTFFCIQQKIDNESWAKAVPMAFEKTKSTVDLKEHCIFHLLRSSANGYKYAFWNNETWFSGLSPEILYEWNGSVIQSLAVAGTSFAGKDIDLKTNSKEMAEHLYVVDGISECLAAFGSVKTGETKTFTSGSLTHLRTALECKNESIKNSSALIEALHPTPALGTYPLQFRREEFRRILSPWPQQLIYGSPFGIITEKWHKIIVAIRNAQQIGEDLYVAAGCGVVKDSRWQEEWLELKAKRQSIRERLGLNG